MIGREHRHSKEKVIAKTVLELIHKEPLAIRQQRVAQEIGYLVLIKQFFNFRF